MEYGPLSYFRLGRTAPRQRARERYVDRLRPRFHPAYVEIIEGLTGRRTVSKTVILTVAAGAVLRLRAWKTAGSGQTIVTIPDGSNITVAK